MEFEMNIGPKADVAELEYISSLHQVSFHPRQDGSISSRDIQMFLASRHGVNVDKETVEKVLMRGGLCGSAAGYQQQQGDSSDINGFVNEKFHDLGAEEDGIKIDLMELVSLLFIPQFMKYAIPEDEREKLSVVCPHLMEGIVKMILYDVTGSMENQKLTLDLIREILLKYGESVAASNEKLVEEMYLLASGGQDGVILDKNTLVQALTGDIYQYNVRNEISQSTNWVDVFGLGESQAWLADTIVLHETPEATNTVKRNKKSRDQEQIEEMPTSPAIFRSMTTWTPIDYAAGTYACSHQMILIWASFIFSYIGYIHLGLQEQKKNLSPCVQDYEPNSGWQKNIDSFGCGVGYGIIDWLLTFVTVTAFGFVYIGAASIGNGVHNTGNVHMVFGTFVVVIWTVGAPILIGFYTKDFFLFYIRLIGILMGFTIIAMRNLILFKQNFPDLARRVWSGMAAPASAIGDEAGIKKAASIKIRKMQEHALKMHNMESFEGSVIKTFYGRAISSFAKSSDESVKVGGYVWGWKQIISGKRTYLYGIWLSARIMAGTFSSLLITIMVLLYGLFFTLYVNENFVPKDQLEDEVYEFLKKFFTAVADYGLVQNTANFLVNQALVFTSRVLYILDDASLLKLDCWALGRYLADVCNENSRHDVTQFACDLFAGKPNEVCLSLENIYQPMVVGTETNTSLPYIEVFNTTAIRGSFADYVSKTTLDNFVLQVNRFYPQTKMVLVAPMLVFTITAFITSVIIASIYGPSLISTVLKVRSGVIPSLRDPMHSQYKYFSNKTSLMTGSIFWGTVFASFFIGGILGSILFLCLWQTSVPLMQQLIALIIAIVIISIVKYLVLRSCRNQVYDGFYREKPLHGNIFMLVNETWNFALSIALVWTRMFVFTILAAGFVGRIDTPFLAKDVGHVKVGDGSTVDFMLDNYYQYFLTDVYTTDAHRHPYIETLGVMYLMKLKYRHTFMTSAGSAWRLIFVTVLMPWLQKYRKLTQGAGHGDTEERKDVVEE